MSRDRVRIGLVGVANHGTTILNAIRAAGDLQLVSCYDVDQSEAKSATIRISHILNSHEE